MEKLKSSLLTMVLVLVGVAMVIGAVLAWVNNITEKPIADKAQQTLANGIRDVMGTADINVDEPDSLTLDLQGKAYAFVIHNVNSTSGDYLGAAVESTTLGFGGDLKVLVGFDAQVFSCAFQAALDYFLGNQLEAELLAAGANGCRNLLKLCGGKDEDDILRRLLDGLEKSIEG